MANLLETYWRKRDFKKTAEPAGEASPGAAKVASTGGLFVVHKHDARRLHYDLRLEHDGVLWSWAVTRGPSLDPAEKRLAVHVEDHPLDYGAFEGTIPEGSYGAGSVVLWDEGKWIPDGDPAAGMKKGHLKFELSGEKLKGSWNLVRLKARGKEKHENWLLIKVKDEYAEMEGDILERAPNSVKSGLSNDEIAEGKKSKSTKPVVQKPEKKISKKPGAKNKPSAMPDFIAPALATLQASPPSAAGWLHEIKFDGYRIQAHISQGKVTLFTRSGLDWTTRFGDALVQDLLALKCDQAILDGEIVVPTDKGVASFALLQGDLSANRTDRMIYYVFDLLHLDNESLLEEPLLERKHKLENLLNKESNSKLQYSEHFEQSGENMLANACRMGLEGVVSKRLDASYKNGRTPDWIKSKCTLRQEFVILGYLPSEATGRGLRSILVGYLKNGKYVFAGRVGTGFTTKSGDDLKLKLSKFKTDKPAVADLPKKEKNAIWVKPELVVEVEFRTWTGDGILRQASFQGLREDKPAKEVVKEQAKEEKPTQKTSARAKKSAVTSAITLSHPEKLLWPDAKVSKQDLLDYYASVWPRMEPFVVNRPLSLLRAPDGINGQRFFQKHASPGMQDAIHVLKDPHDKEEYLYITGFDGLAGLVQLGVVEVHIWGAKIDAIDLPDQVVFDLDPDEGVTADRVRSAAAEVKGHLDDLGFRSFLKTSGGKGFHVIVPLKAKATWDEVKTFSHDFAEAMVQAKPEEYTAKMSKKTRTNRIFIDYLRNGKGSTTVAPYSARAREGATVSIPVEWKALDAKISPAAFAIGQKSTRDILEQTDPWRDFFKAAKALKV